MESPPRNYPRALVLRECKMAFRSESRALHRSKNEEAEQRQKTAKAERSFHKSRSLLLLVVVSSGGRFFAGNRDEISDLKRIYVRGRCKEEWRLFGYCEQQFDYEHSRVQ